MENLYNVIESGLDDEYSEKIVSKDKETPSTIRELEFPGDISGSNERFFKSKPDMLAAMDTLETSIYDGNCLLTLQQFHAVRFVLSRYQKSFVKELPEIGKLKDSTYSLKNSLLHEDP